MIHVAAARADSRSRDGCRRRRDSVFVANDRRQCLPRRRKSSEMLEHKKRLATDLTLCPMSTTRCSCCSHIAAASSNQRTTSAASRGADADVDGACRCLKTNTFRVYVLISDC